MPTKSKAQHRLMAAVANNPEFANKVGIKQSVGKEMIKGNVGKKSYKNLKEKARREAINKLSLRK